MLTLLALLYLQRCVYSQAASSVMSSSSSDRILARCRSERRVHLAQDEYKSDTCARCYKYMPSLAFHVKLLYNSRNGGLFDPGSNLTHFVGSRNVSERVLGSFAADSFAEKWRACCDAAWNCCEQMTNATLTGGLFCPHTWDGWQCWPDAAPGTVSRQPCQDHIYFENAPPSCVRFAHKKCLPNGTWYLNENFKEWTNYSTCGRRDEHRQFLHFHIATYVVSIVSIVPALIIFLSYKQLQVPRITMHKNLFLSLLLNGLFSVVFKAVVVGDEWRRHDGYTSIMERNGAGCKLLFVLTKYFRTSNYMWMFCEGFYLQKLIAATFAEQRSLVVFYVIGWVLPIVPVGIYAILRMTLEDEKCWAFPVEKFEWIMNVPNLLSLLVNLIFLCNIIRVLVTKLRATHAKEPSQYRKAVRATLVLIPLFGLHFCLVIYRPRTGICGLLQAYIYFNYAMDGLQGFMVALIFCYLNGEVLYLIRRTYQRYQLLSQFRSRKNSGGIMRRWSTTLTTLNDSSHHHHRTTKSRGSPPNGEVNRTTVGHQNGDHKSKEVETNGDYKSKEVVETVNRDHEGQRHVVHFKCTEECEL